MASGSACPTDKDLTAKLCFEFRGKEQIVSSKHGCPAAENSSRSAAQCYGAAGVGDSVDSAARFLSSAALWVAAWRRSASDFKSGVGLGALVVASSEREHAPVKSAHTRKTDIRIVFIKLRKRRFEAANFHCYSGRDESATRKKLLLRLAGD